MSARATRAMKRKADNGGESADSTKRQQLDLADQELDKGSPEQETAESTSIYDDNDAASDTASPPGDTNTVGATSISTSRRGRKFPSDMKTIKCTFPGCDKSFNRPARLVSHLRSHTGDRIHRCTYEGCDKSYLEEKHLTQHIKGSHTHEKNYVCNVKGCGKAFVTNTRLKRHAAVHEGAERFRCRDYEGCSESFRKRETLQRHIRTRHLNQAGFPCLQDGCQEGFDSAGALRRHTEREHGQLRFWCDECAKETDEDGEEKRVGFTTLNMLKTHARTEHRACPFCDKKIGRQFQLEEHMENMHSGKSVEERKDVPCNWPGCESMFTRKSNMMTHYRSAHEGKKFVCGEVNTFNTPDIADWNWQEEGCKAPFVSKLKLEEHIRFVHLGRKRPERTITLNFDGPDEVDEMTAAVDKKKLACSVLGCEARFIRYADLNKHLEAHQRQASSIGDGYAQQAQPNVAVEAGYEPRDFIFSVPQDGYGNQDHMLVVPDAGYGDQGHILTANSAYVAPTNRYGNQDHILNDIKNEPGIPDLTGDAPHGLALDPELQASTMDMRLQGPDDQQQQQQQDLDPNFYPALANMLGGDTHANADWNVMNELLGHGQY
ncbi:hypothetical protein QC761_709750 [Podospora bellae-mahoneyi]|uniref:C2H2-type domain-containing protein n=1 Tax=Podospora bellae-mahoneyi TaxID=2093777 RepID=A0ABR0F6G7_9PEZI|nr:hypothetical protein QC761_709750 [Podospora bellae-mahoneyi]